MRIRFFATLLVLVGCAPEGPRDPDVASTRAPVGEPDEPRVPAPRTTLDRGVVALAAEAPPNADPERVLHLAEPVLDLPAGFALLDARWVGDALVVLHPDHSLWRHGEGGRERLDGQVEAPLAVRGSWVAYGRGPMPELEIARLDVTTGRVASLTEGYAPAWNPAIGPEGEVIFVSGRDGGPRLYRVREGASPERLADRGATPSSLRAPTFDGSTLRFEDEAGVEHTLAIATEPIEPIEPTAPGALR